MSNTSPGPRPASLPEAVTGSATWAAMELARALRAAVATALDTCSEPVSLRGYWLLETIAGDARWAQRELGDALGIDRSDMVRLIDRLERADLVARVRDDVDRRRRLITLTAHGDEIRADLRKAIAKAERTAIGEVDPAIAAALSGTAREAAKKHKKNKKKAKKKKDRKKGAK